MKQNTPLTILVIVLAFLFVACDGLQIINYPPWSTHIFRQSDCLAYTKRYYADNLSFFSPACYNLIGNDGRVVSEFPILYYISARLCHLFGFHFGLIRGVNILCYFAGLIYIFLCIRLWIKDIVISVFPVIILASSPVLYFYAVGFLPNVPAIAFSFAGLYHMLRYRSSEARFHLITATVFFVLATLLKPTDGGIVWVSYMGLLIADRKDSAWQGKKKPIYLASLIVALFTVAWYFFVKAYNQKNGNDINLQGIYPIWDMTWKDIWITIDYRILQLGPDIFHHVALLFLLAGLLLLYIVFWRRLHKFLRQFTLMLLLASLVYAVLWYQAFMVHDYYQLVFAVPAVFLSITMLEYYDRVLRPNNTRYERYAVNIILAAGMTGAIFHNQSIQQERFDSKNMGFDNIDVCHEAVPYLRKAGISANDIVLVGQDGSPNISLSAFGNKGYTADLFGRGRFSVQFARDGGAKYLILLKPNFADSAEYVNYTKKLICSYKNIRAYDISWLPIKEVVEEGKRRW